MLLIIMLSEILVYFLETLVRWSLVIYFIVVLPVLKSDLAPQDGIRTGRNSFSSVTRVRAATMV